MMTSIITMISITNATTITPAIVPPTNTSVPEPSAVQNGVFE